MGHDTRIPAGGIPPPFRAPFRDAGHHPESAPCRPWRPNRRFRWRRRRAPQVSVAPRRGAPAPWSGGDPLHTHPCPAASSHPRPPRAGGRLSPAARGRGPDPSPRIGPTGAQRRGLARRPGRSAQAPVAARGGRWRDVSPLRRDTAPGREKGPGQDQGQRVRGAPRSPAPATEPGASRERGRLEQRRGPDPLGRPHGIWGERARDFPRGVFIFNFKLLVVYLFLLKREPVAWADHLAQAKPSVCSCPPGRFAPA